MSKYERKIVDNGEVVGFLGCEFSNFYYCNFYLNGLNFKNSEQAFMYCKAKLFRDEEIAELILKNPDPKKCKSLGRKVKGFNEDKWNEKKDDYMYIILKSKFNSDDKLKSMLLKTDNKLIAECSPFDKEWGIGIGVDDMLYGVRWNGDNKLGKCLMKVRDYLKESN